MLMSNAFPRPPVVKAIGRTCGACPGALSVVGSALWPITRLDSPLVSFIPAITPQIGRPGKALAVIMHGIATGHELAPS